MKLFNNNKMERMSYNNHRSTILSILSSGDNYYSFYNFLTKISNKYNLEINEGTNVKELIVKGEKGYNIIADIFYILKELEQNHIIILIKNETSTPKKYNIGSQPNGDTCKITGDLLNFLRDNICANIWMTPDIEWYKNHNYQTKELVEAKHQTYLALMTLLIAIITICITIFLYKVISLIIQKSYKDSCSYFTADNTITYDTRL